MDHQVKMEMDHQVKMEMDHQVKEERRLQDQTESLLLHQQQTLPDPYCHPRRRAVTRILPLLRLEALASPAKPRSLR